MFAISFSIIAGKSSSICCNLFVLWMWIVLHHMTILFFYKVLIWNKLSAGVDRTIITYMLSTTKIIAVFIWFPVVGVYTDHLQLMRCTLAFNHWLTHLVLLHNTCLIDCQKVQFLVWSTLSFAFWLWSVFLVFSIVLYLIIFLKKIFSPIASNVILSPSGWPPLVFKFSLFPWFLNFLY